MCVRACVCACVSACVRVCVCVDEIVVSNLIILASIVFYLFEGRKPGIPCPSYTYPTSTVICPLTKSLFLFFFPLQLQMDFCEVQLQESGL